MVTNSLSNFLGSQDTSKSNENFLKEFSRNFYQKIINIKDFNTFENILSEWIKNIDKNPETIFELMKNHEMNEFWFSSIIGFFYQFGLCCDVDDSKALEFYLLAVNDDEKEFLNHNFTHVHLNDNEFNALKNINNIIGKYLLSLFYYKDILLDERKFIKYLKFAQKGDSEAQHSLGECYYYGREVSQDYEKAFKWYSRSANNGFSEGQISLGDCYKLGRGITQDYKKAFECYSKSAFNGSALGQI